MCICIQRLLETSVTPNDDLPVQVLSQLGEISRQLEQHMTSVNQQLANVNKSLSSIHQRTVTLETLVRDRSTSLTEAADVAGLAVAGEQVSDEQRRLLQRSPMVTNDQQWAELEATLVDSGRHGLFFNALVCTVKDRIIDRSDVHKTANATLRTLISETYLAERVTMAGYKKRKIYPCFIIIIITIIPSVL